MPLFDPYIKYIQELRILLDKCRSKKDPALYLHHKNARSCLFMLESIARLDLKSGNEKAKKRFKFFKKLEDLFGILDQQLSVVETVKKKGAYSKTHQEHFIQIKNKTLASINLLLQKNNYFEKKLIRLSKPLIDINTKEVIDSYRKVIRTDIEKTYAFFKSCPKEFNDMELQVHELRRKLRWISIYAQSLQGIIVLKESRISYKWEKEFITKEVLSNPYNSIPLNSHYNFNIAYHKKAFLALSKVISELGLIKDKGLLQETLFKELATNRKENTKLNNNSFIAENKALLKQAHQLLSLFFIKYRIHRLLVTNP